MKKEDVAVIIVNWNNPDDSVECIESLESILYDSFNDKIIKSLAD